MNIIVQDEIITRNILNQIKKNLLLIPLLKKI